MFDQYAFIPRPAKHFIGGEFVSSADQKYFATINPATGTVLTEVALGGEAEINAAVAAAKAAAAQYEWREMPRGRRVELLRAIANGIENRLRDLAILETLDTGKPLGETINGDIPRAARNFRYFADLLSNERCETFCGDDGSRHTVKREPLGVVGLITPWNLPLYLATWKAAPALAQGNAIVLKPAEWTPLTATLLGEIMRDAGVPPGVFNVVHGFGPGGAGEALVRHADVRAISFTGETGTGRAIMGAAAAGLKKISFELGGKGSSVVFPDADLDEAAKTVVHAAFRNQGQICLAGSRLIVHESVEREFSLKVLEHVRKIRIGDPLDEATTMGSLIHETHAQRVEGYVNHARQTGGTILAGGQRPPHSKGAFFEPTVIAGVAQDSRLIQEEIFGPVLTVQTFHDLDEALALVNGTPYGLSTSVWSQNAATTQKFAEGARTGLVWINSWFLRHLGTAFGGMKQSGIGREGGHHSFDFYAELKTVSERRY